MIFKNVLQKFSPLRATTRKVENLRERERVKSLNLKKKGFTLIELLIVIAIIGLLSSVVLASLNTARKKARDAKRRSDLKQLSLALEMYYDANNAYPSSGGVWRGSGAECSTYNGGGTYTTSGALGWIPNLAPTYIPVLPLDPKPFGGDHCYLYNSNGADYKVIAHQTTESVCPTPISDGMYDPARAGQCTFAVYTPGATW